MGQSKILMIRQKNDQRVKSQMIVRTKSKKLSKWVALQQTFVSDDTNSEEQLFHSLQIDDYVSSIVLDQDKNFVLVRQFRPAINQFSLEFPGGLLDDPKIPPNVTMAREIHEETGYIVDAGNLTYLGKSWTDTGRLGNKLWSYFAVVGEKDQNWKPEPGISVVILNKNELKKIIRENICFSAIHLSLLGKAAIKGLVKW